MHTTVPRTGPKGRASTALLRGLRSIFRDVRSRPSEKLAAARLLMLLGGYLPTADNKKTEYERPAAPSLQNLIDLMNAEKSSGAE